jgi:predicted RNA-binding Zn ribbon-like protein
MGNTKKRPFKWVAGWLCLDFVNTKNWDSHDPIYERFHHYPDLVQWNDEAGLLTTWEVHQLFEMAEKHPTEAEAVFEQGLTLRTLIHQIFSAIATEQMPPAADLAQLNTALLDILALSKIIQHEEGFKWAWAGQTEAPERVLWPLLRSTTELLTTGQLQRVGQCAGSSCGWLFLDTSRNHSRRWCQMQHCGNQAKARRYYQRKRVG